MTTLLVVGLALLVVLVVAFVGFVALGIWGLRAFDWEDRSR